MDTNTLQARIDQKANEVARRKVEELCNAVGSAIHALTGKSLQDWHLLCHKEKEGSAAGNLFHLMRGRPHASDWPFLVDTIRDEITKQVLDAVDQVKDILAVQEDLQSRIS
jgi:hypothetical protein